MYKILVALDGSEHSDKVANEALTLAEPLKAEVTFLTVISRSHLPSGVSLHFTDADWDKINHDLQKESEEMIEKAAAPFKEKGLKTEAKIIFERKAPSEVICEFAENGNYNLVMLGSHGLRGFREAFLGSVSNKVAHCLSGNVMIVK